MAVSRIAIVGVVLLGWFVLTNHCALGMMRPSPEAKAQHTCCHGGATQPSNEAPEVPQQCCKNIKAALLADDAKVQPPAADYIFAILLLSAKESAAAAEPARLAHAPPKFAASFAEIVLQRSLLSHAPPILS